MVDDALLATAVVGEDVPHDDDVEAVLGQAGRVGATLLHVRVRRFPRVEQRTGRGERLLVAVDADHLALRTDEFREKREDRPRAAADVRDAGPGTDAGRIPQVALAVPGVLRHEAVAGEFRVAEPQRVRHRRPP